MILRRNKLMKTYYECIPCFINQVLRALPSIEKSQHELILREVLHLLAGMDFELSPPEMARNIFTIIEKYSGEKDLYAEIKRSSNKYILDMEDELREIIKDSTDSFLTGLHLAIAGNIIDFGAKHDFSDKLIHKEIEDALAVKLDTASVEEMQQLIEEADTILYLGDNSGEIVFDKLFIEQLPKEKIIFAVRGGHIINDVLKQDAEDVGLSRIVRVVDNGFNAPGTVIEHCSDEFQEIFEGADLIISKGQGNYETLSDCSKSKKIVFLLKIKCDIVARDLKGSVGDFVIKVTP
jgi:uncharacterized protein with ATP-grasp and redox domains